MEGRRIRVITTILGLLVVSTTIAAQDLEPPPPIEEPAVQPAGPGLEPDLPAGLGLEPGPEPGPDFGPGLGGGKKAEETAFALADSSDYPQVVLQRLPPVKGTEDTMAGMYLGAEVVDQSIIDNSTFTARALPTPYLLPAPEDGNDIFYSQLNAGDQRLHLGTQPLGYAYFLGGNENKVENIWTRFKAQPHFGFYYDTGQVTGDTFDVTQIVLGDPMGAGQTKFISGDDMLTPVILMGDAQLVDASALGGTQVQLLVEANNHQVADQLDVRSLFVRAWNQGDLSVAAGKGYSLFEVGGALPSTLTQAGRLIGSGEINDENKPAQLRLQRTAPKGSWGWGVGIEDPETPDFSTPAGGEELTRWPTGAAQVAYNGEDGVDRIQFSALMRNLGFESAARQEYFTTGWGLAAYAFIGRQVSDSDRDGFYAGVAGGEAVGQYIQGITQAAVFAGGDLTSLSALGAYTGYKRQWETCSGVAYGVNAAYGYAVMEDEPTFPDVNRELHQAWANFMVLPSNSTAVGVEYQFGRRETHANEDGEDHRFLLIVAFTTSAKKDGSVASASASALADESTPVSGTAALQRF